MKTFFFFFFGEHLRFVSLVLGLGLEHSCPWPRECLSSERLSLALASDFFCVLGLGLEPCVLDSTSANHVFAQLISMPPKSYLMLRLKSSIFYQNKPKIKLLLQKENFSSAGVFAPRPPMASGGAPKPPEHSPSPHYRFMITRLILDVCCSYIQVLESYNEKFLSWSNNSRYLQQ